MPIPTQDANRPRSADEMARLTRRAFVKAAIAIPAGLFAAEKVMAAGLVNSGLTFSEDYENEVLNAVADTILPRMNDGRPNDWSAGELDLPRRFYRDPYFGISGYLGFLINDVQGRAFFAYTEAFQDLNYEQRRAVFEDGRNNAFGPVKRVFNGIIALTYYAVFAQTEQGRSFVGLSLDPSGNWANNGYPGATFPPSGLAPEGNLP